jgi:cellulose synthase/poly-beta-1,6-N-acetylglucosamine synthase-like glycosyltransferase/peptidoglycan/xylan/chitin deacetylase (PgdA/CDA1 family)/spore germination protein YaaH
MKPQQVQVPTFLDPTGRRWRRLRVGAVVAGVVSTVLFLFVVTGVIVPPLLPGLPFVQTAADSLGHAPRVPRPVVKHPISVRAERERVASRQRLFAYLAKHPAEPGLRYAQLPIARPHTPPEPAGHPIVTGFYVNWDDNSLASLRSHISALDWVVAEWGFVRADTVPVRFEVDRRVLAEAALAARANRPVQIFALVTNFTGNDFDAGALTRLLEHPRLSRRAISTIADTLARYDLAGVTIDFENVPRAEHPALLRFLGALKTRLARDHRLVTQAIPGDDPEWPVERYGALDDYVFLMLYDEHDPSDDPGPIASQAWFERHLARVLARVPPAKVIVSVGQYGYEWSDTTASATELTFQDVMQLARIHGRAPAMESGAANPMLAWDDPDSTGHIVWFLDAATAYNQVRRALPLGIRGVGVWRLGSEDPSLWTVLDRDGLHARPQALDTIRIGYDVEFVGTGEILRMVAQPTLGRRTVRVDTITGEIVVDSVLTTPSTYIIERYGRRKHTVALTFDDGPDATWTPMILDTLQSRDATATFFVIGENAELHPALLRRILREGHEIGNHTFTHPNLALVGATLTRFELSATERLIEAVVNRRTALFRPPYFGDAEPTTADELGPIAVAQDLGYVTVGLRDDPGDWLEPGVDTIVQRSLAQLERGNVILLHDGGGNRAQTVAALGPLIDSLRARGYQLTTVSELAGLTRDEAMAPLPRSTALRRFVELTSFSLVGWIELALRTAFLLAMALGALRLVVLLALAVRQRRLHPFARRGSDAGYHPSVSVVVPAYNEEGVIARTVQSLLEQHYAGLEILVVDDGSSDRTATLVDEAFGQHHRVRVFTKPNGGKASALNFGLARARGEIVVAVDGDTLLAPGAIAALVAPLADARIGAVAGNAKVGNRINLVTRWQAVEYITSQNLDRRAFALLNCITVVPGAIGAWRRTLVVDAGGFSEQTLAEDQDLTLTILERGWRIAYADDAVAYTEAPDTLGALSRQRFRWSFGTLQCAWKHRGALFRRRSRALGFVALPNVWIFQLAFPFLAPAADVLFGWSLLTVYLNKLQHGAEYAMQSLEQVLAFYVAFLAVDWLAGIAALVMEKGEEKGLAWLVLLQRFVYRQVLYWAVVRAVWAAAQGRARGWGKLARKGTVELPKAA